MGAETRLEYDRSPRVLPAYVRAATTWSGGLDSNGTIPKITAHLPGLTVRTDNLARYQQVCGFARTPVLPVTYPHVLAFPLQMAVMTHKRFPLKLLGLIHVRNEITQHRALAADETLDVTVSVGGHRDTERGIEFDLVTALADAAGNSIWQEWSTMLSRRSHGTRKKGTRNGGKSTPELSFEPQHETYWDVPADTGRRYAAVAGDYNPIHLSRWSARLFGFPRAIATGMWTKARAAAELAPHLDHDAYTLRVAFKKPVWLPSKACFVHTLDARRADFALIDGKGDTVYLSGDVRYR